MYIKYFILKEVPLVRITIILLIGLVCGFSFPSAKTTIAFSCLILFLVLLSILWRIKANANSIYQYHYLFSIGLFFSIFLSGYLLAVTSQQQNIRHYTAQKNFAEEQTYSIKITEAIEHKTNSLKLLGTIQNVLKKDQTVSLSGNVICYLQKDSLGQSLKINDVIVATTSIRLIEQAKNPKELNYKEYLANQSIHGTCYISSDKWLILTRKKQYSFKSSIAQLRGYLSNHIKRYVKDAREEQIALAILIGEKTNLEVETKRIYASSGAMHILAVSGLHVGIVYLLFNAGLFFLNKEKVRWLKPPILIILIWLYAFLSGASPSVLRASTMFTFIAIGQAFRRHINIYNMVAASALILILINPLIIKSLGFQLSYIAVIGILLLYQKIYKLYTTEIYILDKIWSLSAVSIAAQISTFPLSLLYFHQFPNLFLLSNLIVIPAAIAIVYVGMLLLIVSFSPFLSKIVGFVLENIIYWLNEFIALIDKIPIATSTNIHFTLYACLLSYLFITSLSIAIFYRKKHFLVLCLSILLCIIIGFSMDKYHENEDSHLLVYSIKDYSAIEIKEGSQVYTFWDSSLLATPQKINYHITPNQTSYGQKELLPMDRNDNYNLLKIKGHSILLINQGFTIPNNCISIDYVIISHQSRLYFKDLAEKVNADKYIFDTSNNRNQHYYWKKDCESLNLDCYFVSDSFAFEEKL